MSRDHRKLRVFRLADRLVLDIYRLTRGLPEAEKFGLQAQLRRAAVSTVSNIVEGSARASTFEYRHFLNIASGSAAEARYLMELTCRLGNAPARLGDPVVDEYSRLLAGLESLYRSLGQLQSSVGDPPRSVESSSTRRPLSCRRHG